MSQNYKNFKEMDENVIAHHIEQCAIDDDYWLQKSKLFEDLSISLDGLQKILENSDLIVMNSDGELTTRQLYKKRTSFKDRLFNAINNKIT